MSVSQSEWSDSSEDDGSTHAEVAEALDDDLRTQWEERGFDPMRFDKEKMLSILEKEEEEKQLAQEAIGVNLYKEKMEKIKVQKETRDKYNPMTYVKAANAFAVRSAADTKAWSKEAAKEALRSAELPYFRRKRLKREAEEREAKRIEDERLAIEEAELEERQYQARKVWNRKQKEERAAKVKADEPRRKQLHELTEKGRADTLRAERERFEARKAEQRAEADAQKAARMAAMRKKQVDFTDFARGQAMAKWGEFARQHKREAVTRVKNIDAARDARAAKQRADRAAEEAARVAKLRTEEANIPELSTPTPGVGELSGPIFGVPIGRGEFASKDPSGGHIPGVDEVDVPIGKGDIDAGTLRWELRNQAVQRLQSRLDSVNESLDRWSTVDRKLDEEEATIRERIEKTASDLKEIAVLERKLQTKLDGPPQRSALPGEVIASHNRKRRRQGMLRERAKINARLEVMHKERAHAAAMVSQLTKKSKRLTAEVERRREGLEIEHEHEVQLPVVVGRRLADVMTEESHNISVEEEAERRVKRVELRKKEAAKQEFRAEQEKLRASGQAQLEEKKVPTTPRDAVERQMAERHMSPLKLKLRERETRKKQMERDRKLRARARALGVTVEELEAEAPRRPTEDMRKEGATIETVLMPKDRVLESDSEDEDAPAPPHGKSLPKGWKSREATPRKDEGAANGGEEAGPGTGADGASVAPSEFTEATDDVSLIMEDDRPPVSPNKLPKPDIEVERPVAEQQKEIVLNSQLELTRVATEQLNLLHQSLARTDHKLWQMRMSNADLVHELERGKSVAQGIKDSLRASEEEIVRGDIVTAVERFWRARERLRRVDIANTGYINFWTNATNYDEVFAWDGVEDVKARKGGGLLKGAMDRRASQATAVSKSSALEVPEGGVRLGAAKYGRITGGYDLPSHGLWRIRCVVTKANPRCIGRGATRGDPRDYVAIGFGHNKENCKVIKRVYNTRTPGRADVFTTVEYVITGSHVAFDHQFYSQHTDKAEHLIVLHGYFEDEKIPELVVSDHRTGQVLSDYVKRERILQSQGESRATILLEELIRIENAEAAEQADYERQLGALQDALAKEERKAERAKKRGEKRADLSEAKRAEVMEFIKERRRRQRAKIIDSGVLHQGVPQRYPLLKFIDALKAELARESGVLQRAQQERVKALLDKRKEDRQRAQDAAWQGETKESTPMTSANPSRPPSASTVASAAVSGGMRPVSSGSALSGGAIQLEGFDPHPDFPPRPADRPMSASTRPGSANTFGSASLPSEAPSLPSIQPFKFETSTDAETHFPPLRLRSKEQAMYNAKVNLSAARWLERKRAGAVADVDAAREIVGRRAEVFDEETNSWKQAVIKDCKVEWRNNGTTVHVLHKLQYRDVSLGTSAAAKAERAEKLRRKRERKRRKREREAQMGETEDGISHPFGLDAPKTVELSDVVSEDGGVAYDRAAGPVDEDAPVEVGANGEAVDVDGARSIGSRSGASRASQASQKSRESRGGASGAAGSSVGSGTDQVSAVDEHADGSFASGSASESGQSETKEEGVDDDAEEEEELTPRTKAKRERDELFSDAVWIDLSLHKHHILSGDAERIEKMREDLQKEADEKEERAARKAAKDARAEREFYRMLEARKAQALAEFQVEREGALDAVRQAANLACDQKLDAIREDAKADEELYEQFEQGAHKLVVEYRQGWKREAYSMMEEIILTSVGAGAGSALTDLKKDLTLVSSSEDDEEESMSARMRRINGEEEEDFESRLDRESRERERAKRRKKKRKQGAFKDLFDIARNKLIRQWRDEIVLKALEDEERKWVRRLARLKDKLLEERNDLIEQRELEKEEEIRQEKLRALEREQAGLEWRKKIQARPDLKIPKLAQTIDPGFSGKCSHKNVKYWGHEWGKGLICLDCGLELTDEEAMLRAAYDDMDRAMERHGRRGGGDAQQFYGDPGGRKITLADVERERVRVEKERRLVEESDALFADFEHQRVVRDADIRHHIRAEERDGDEVAAPTFRRHEAQHRAAFHEMLQYFSRVKAFKTRITELRDLRDDLLGDKAVFTARLDVLYTRAYELRDRQDVLGLEHDRAEDMINRYRAAKQNHTDAFRKLTRTRRQLLRAVAKSDELHQVALRCSEIADIVDAQLEDMMFWWRWSQSKQVEALEQRSQAEDELTTINEKFAASRRLLSAVQWQTKGMSYPTPRYGFCEVVSYRHLDHMLILRPKWKNMPSTTLIYMPVETVVAVEAARSEVEWIAMVDEDNAALELRKAEVGTQRQEIALMAVEDAEMHEYDVWLKSEAEEKGSISRKMELAKWAAQAEIEIDAVQAALYVAVEKEVDEALGAVDDAIALFKASGKGDKPKKMGWWTRRKLRKRIYERMVNDRIDAAVEKARKAAHREFCVKRDKRTTELTIEENFREFLNAILTQAAVEALQDGLLAKERAEEEAGWVTQYPEMQYMLYRTLYKQWNDRKQALLSAVRKWLQRKSTADIGKAVVLTRDQLDNEEEASESESSADEFALEEINGPDEESGEDDELDDDWVTRMARFEWEQRGLDPDAFTVEALERIKKQEAAFLFNEKAKERKHLREMEREERELRAFYTAERRLNLMERWAMADEERYMKDFLAKEAMAKALGDTPGRPGGGKPGERNKLARRHSLKLNVVQRQKQKREWRDMMAEDALALELREEDMRLARLEEQRKRMLEAERLRRQALEEEEFGYGSTDDDDVTTDSDDSTEGATTSAGPTTTMAGSVPVESDAEYKRAESGWRQKQADKRKKKKRKRKSKNKKKELEKAAAAAAADEQADGDDADTEEGQEDSDEEIERFGRAALVAGMSKAGLLDDLLGMVQDESTEQRVTKRTPMLVVDESMFIIGDKEDDFEADFGPRFDAYVVEETGVVGSHARDKRRKEQAELQVIMARQREADAEAAEIARLKETGQWREPTPFELAEKQRKADEEERRKAEKKKARYDKQRAKAEKEAKKAHRLKEIELKQRTKQMEKRNKRREWEYDDASVAEMGFGANFEDPDETLRGLVEKGIEAFIPVELGGLRKPDGTLKGEDDEDDRDTPGSPAKAPGSGKLHPLDAIQEESSKEKKPKGGKPHPLDLLKRARAEKKKEGEEDDGPVVVDGIELTPEEVKEDEERAHRLKLLTAGVERPPPEDFLYLLPNPFHIDPVLPAEAIVLQEDDDDEESDDEWSTTTESSMPTARSMGTPRSVGDGAGAQGGAGAAATGVYEGVDGLDRIGGAGRGAPAGRRSSRALGLRRRSSRFSQRGRRRSSLLSRGSMRSMRSLGGGSARSLRSHRSQRSITSADSRHSVLSGKLYTRSSMRRRASQASVARLEHLALESKDRNARAEEGDSDAESDFVMPPENDEQPEYEKDPKTRLLFAPALVIPGLPSHATTPTPSQPLPMPLLPLPYSALAHFYEQRKRMEKAEAFLDAILDKFEEDEEEIWEERKERAEREAAEAAAKEEAERKERQRRRFWSKKKRDYMDKKEAEAKAAREAEEKAKRDAEAAAEQARLDSMTDEERAAETMAAMSKEQKRKDRMRAEFDRQLKLKKTLEWVQPRLKYRICDREWRMRLRWGEELKQETFNREKAELAAHELKVQARSAQIRDEILEAKLVMDERLPTYDLFREPTLFRYEVVVRDAQDAADASRLALIEYRAQQKARAMRLIEKKRMRRRLRRLKKLEAEELRAAGVKSFHELRNGMVKYTRLKTGESHYASATNVPQTMSDLLVSAGEVDYSLPEGQALADVIRDLGGIDVIVEEDSDEGAVSDEGEEGHEVALVHDGHVGGMGALPGESPKASSKNASPSEKVQDEKHVKFKKKTLVHRAAERLTDIEEEENRRAAMRERKLKKRGILNRMDRKAAENMGLVEAETDKAPELDDYSIKLQQRAEKLAGQSARMEMQLMAVTERAQLADKVLRRANHNAARIKSRVQVKAAEAKRTRANQIASEKALMAQREYAAKLQHRVNRRAEVEEELREELRMVKLETEYMDTVVLHNRRQRFKTSLLARRLHHYFFEALLDDIIVRAESIGIERKMRRNVEVLQSAKRSADSRVEQLAHIKKKFARKQKMLLRRSELGKTLFHRSRRHCLLRSFKGWWRFVEWRRSVRGNYTVQYDLHKQWRDLARLESERRKAVEHQSGATKVPPADRFHEIGDVGGALQRGMEGSPDPRLSSGRSGRPPAPPGTRGATFEPGGFMGGDIASNLRTVMGRHNNRWVSCKHCGVRFAVRQNHALACAYHPGRFEMACPPGCPGFQPSCVSHYRKRWTCCGDTRKGGDGSGGCAKRWHIPEKEQVLEDRTERIIEDLRNADIINAGRHAEVREWSERARLNGLRLRNRSEAETQQQRDLAKLADRLK